MATPKQRAVGVVIDKITNSIENAVTGESFATEVERLYPNDNGQIKKSMWKFDWGMELSDINKEVYKLVTTENRKVLHGLISIADGGDHIYLHLIENSKFNLGKTKQYRGVAANLFAFCCKKAFDCGYQGFVLFIAKTKLIDHYEKSLGAVRIGGHRMIIEQEAAKNLVNKYYRGESR